VHGHIGNPIGELAATLGYGFGTRTWDLVATFVDGRELPAPETAQAAAARAALDTALERAAAEADDSAALGPVLRPMLDALDPAVRPAVEAWVRGEYENLYAAPIDRLSLRHRAEPFYLPGEDRMLHGGLGCGSWVCAPATTPAGSSTPPPARSRPRPSSSPFPSAPCRPAACASIHRCPTT
jgi:hypothetical protein